MSSGIPELDAIIKASRTKFGRPAKGFKGEVIEPITTGSIILDQALRIGGFPRGRVIELFGWESSGKTSLALAVMARAQQLRKQRKQKKRDLIIDIEHSLTDSFIEGFGIDLSEVVWERPDSADEALQMAIDFPKSGFIDTCLFDSVDSAQSAKQLALDVSTVEKNRGGIAKEMNFAVRDISKIAPNTGTTYMFINQLRDSPEAYTGPRTSGGNALKFYSSLRLEMRKHKPSEETPNAFRMQVKIVKTKIGKPYGSDPVEFDFVYAKGADPFSSLKEYAESLGLFRMAGPAAQWLTDGEFVTICSGGKAKFREWLVNNPAEYEALVQKCLSLQKP